MTPVRIAGAVLLAVGLALLGFAWHASQAPLDQLTCFIHGVEGERQARWPLGVREGGAICAVCAELTA